MSDSIWCGDCGSRTVLLFHKNGIDRVRKCKTCGATALQKRVVSVTGSTSTVYKKVKKREVEAPKAVKFPEIKFTGGGARGACHDCGNAREECECA
jgi:DNA-directed RNA polymerase subunit M/transcription elongation factor TFIIS